MAATKYFLKFPYFVAALGLLFTFFGFSEFYNVKIAGQSSAYPFGSVNENIWYYQNATIYANYNLLSGVLFLAASYLTIWATRRGKDKAVILGIILLFFLLFVEFISSRFQF